MSWYDYLFGSAEFLPHGYCLVWEPRLLALHVGADALIALSYFSIPAVLYVFARRRTDFEYRWVLHLFAAFIFFCGTSHLVEIGSLWHPYYGFEGMVKLATGLVSVVTAILLWPLLPKVLALPSPTAMQLTNQQLAAEVARREQTEQALRRTYAQLDARTREVIESKDARLQLAIASVGGGEWEWDARSGEPSYVSPSLMRLVGWPEGVEAGFDGWLAIVHPDDRERLVEAAGQFRAGTLDSHHFSYRVVAADDDVLWLESHGRLIRDEFGIPLRYVGIDLDVTDRYRWAADVEEARERAEKADKAKTTFLAAMSHELRTPLNAVVGFSEILKDGLFGPLGDRYSRYADYIHQSAGHLQSLVNDLLDLARIEAGRLDLEPVPVPVADAVDEAVTIVSAHAAQKRIALSVQGIPLEAGVADGPGVGKDGVVVQADRRALRQMLLNLLSNAVKFTHAQGRVSVTWRLRDSLDPEDRGTREEGPSEDARSDPDAGVPWLEISVSDTGIGLSAGDLEMIGQPFARFGEAVSEVRPVQSTGLGLAVTRQLMEAHGGRLDVASVEGRGTTITLLFPPAALTAAAVPADKPQPA